MELNSGVNPASYTNAQFLASFAGAFTAFAKSDDPNVHPVPDIITPSWETYGEGKKEMLFNKTQDEQPDIRPFQTDSELLARCECVQFELP